MEKKLGSGFGVLAVLAFIVHAAFPPASERGSGAAESQKQQKQKAAAPAAPEQQLVEGPWLATRAFFAASNAKTPEINSQNLASRLAAVGEIDAAAARELLAVASNDYEMQCIVATVADPVHTHLPLLFDQQVEAIETAAERLGWEFARQWLPWPISTPSKDGSFEDRLAEMKSERAQESLPGVLVFRHLQEAGSFPNKGLLIFLVPETPTAGIAAAPFNSAMNLALAAAPHVGLLAPTFSGSFESLTRLVNRWKTQPEFKRLYPAVYSGTASSSVRGKIFSGQTGLEFHSGVASISEAQHAFTELLGRYGISESHAAYLVEGESGYAKSFILQEASPIKTYRYPRDIANLRNAYQEATGTESTKGGSQAAVDFTLKDHSHGEDTVPVFSDTHTPVVQSALLSSIAKDFRERQIELVYVVATNTLDALFLARVIRKGSPSTRVLVGGGDLLFVPAASQESVSGTLFLSSYPLFLQGNRWISRDEDHIHPFPSANFQGLYMETRTLLYAMAGNALDPHREQFLEDERSAFSGLWLLTVTRHGLAPLSWFAKESNAIGNDHNTPRFNSPPPSLGWFLSLITVGLAALLTSFLILRANLADASPVPFWLALHEDSVGSVLSLLGICLSLSMMVLLLGLPAWQYVLQGSPANALALELFSIIALAAPIAAMATVALRRVQLLRCVCLRHKLLAGGLGAAYLFFGAAWAMSCYGHSSQADLLFRYRVLDLYSGFSPAAPLLILCLVFLMRFLMLLRRYSEVAWDSPALIFNENVKMHALMRPHVLAVEEHLKSGIAAVDQSITAPVAWRYTALGSLVVLCLLPLLPSLHAFELFPFSLVLQLAVALVSLGGAVACQDLIHLWKSLRKMLQLLEMSPLRGAIGRVVRRWPRQPVWALWRAISRPRLAAQMLLALHNRHQSVIGAYGLLIDYTHFRRLSEARFTEPGSKRGREYYAALFAYEHECATLAAQILERELVPYWDKSPLDDNGDPPIAGKESPIDTAARFGADFVALQLCNYILFAVHHTQRLAWNISLGLLLLIVALASYHPQSPQFLARMLAVILVGFSGVMAWVFAGMERNWVLSRIGRTRPGQLNFEFWARLASVLILPLSAVLVHLFPSLSGLLSDVIAPSMEALK
jgi:hypothetical protein